MEEEERGADESGEDESGDDDAGEDEEDEDEEGESDADDEAGPHGDSDESDDDEDERKPAGEEPSREEPTREQDHAREQRSGGETLVDEDGDVPGFHDEETAVETDNDATVDEDYDVIDHLTSEPYPEGTGPRHRRAADVYSDPSRGLLHRRGG